MSKIQVRIENGLRSYTSLRSAKEKVARGLAAWIAYGAAIRMVAERERVVEHQEIAAQRRDASYWREIERQRGGAEGSLCFNMVVRATPPTEHGGPQGIVSVCFEPVVKHA